VDSQTALVFCGGGRVEAPLPAADHVLVVAADGGAAEAHRLGFRVDLLIGDLDSVSRDDVQRVTADGGRVVRHPVDKDATDLELAIEAAATEGATRLVVVGGHLGRLDHLLGNMLVLALPRFADLEIDAILGPARIHVVRTRRELTGEPGELISLFALGGVATGVTTTGLLWTLVGEDLPPGETRGISNRFADPTATIELAGGVLLAVRPGGRQP
jgi:thiamine pyrophosphokinase